MDAQDNNRTALNTHQQSMAAIAALTATGNIQQLKIALGAGLDAGLTVNEIKEALVQLYAYCGFPRSLNAINALMTVLEERKARGIRDAEGKEETQAVQKTHCARCALRSDEEQDGPDPIARQSSSAESLAICCWR